MTNEDLHKFIEDILSLSNQQAELINNLTTQNHNLTEELEFYKQYAAMANAEIQRLNNNKQ